MCQLSVRDTCLDKGLGGTDSSKPANTCYKVTYYMMSHIESRMSTLQMSTPIHSYPLGSGGNRNVKEYYISCQSTLQYSILYFLLK